MDFRRLGPCMDLVPYLRGAWLRRQAGRGGLALDVGGGTGRVARRLRGAFARVVLVDVEPAMLRRGRRRGFECVVADAARLPFRDGRADLVLMVDAWHHFPRQEEALDEAARVLRPGGRLVVEEFDPRSLGGRLVRAFEALLRFGSRFAPPETLRRLAEARGLEAAAVRHSAREYAVVARRPGGGA